MVKEFDKAGLPTVHMVNMVPVAKDVGSGRIFPTVSIPHPLGDPNLSQDKQYELRKHMVKGALKTLTVHIEEQKIFSIS